MFGVKVFVFIISLFYPNSDIVVQTVLQICTCCKFHVFLLGQFLYCKRWLIRSAGTFKTLAIPRGSGLLRLAKRFSEMQKSFLVYFISTIFNLVVANDNYFNSPEGFFYSPRSTPRGFWNDFENGRTFNLKTYFSP